MRTGIATVAIALLVGVLQAAREAGKPIPPPRYRPAIYQTEP
jgi:hypothetical protein